jgi:transcriptional regulator with XRE-family HTH domain
MNDEWRKRLSEAVANSKKSKRQVSLEAGLGAGYVHSILSEGKDPTVANLMKVCEKLNVSLWAILYGADISAEDEELLRLYQASSPSERSALLNLVRSRKQS